LITLKHPGLAEVLEVGEYERTLFVSREYIAQTPFQVKLDDSEPLSLLDARHIASQVGEALQELASAGIKHGNLSAKNLFVLSDGTVRLTDPAFRSNGSQLSIGGVACRIGVAGKPVPDHA